MKSSEQLLLELVAIGLGNSDRLSCPPTNKGWEEIYALAEVQGLLGITFYAIEKLDSIKPDIDLLMEWLGQTEFLKSHYEEYKQAISKLANVYDRECLRMLILKGYGCSLNYPIPEVRPCGDIDIYLYTKEHGHEGVYTLFADTVMKSKFAVDVNKELRHHTQFDFEGFTVENHNTILEIHTHKSSRKLNEMLEEMVQESFPSTVNGQKVWLPSSRFNSLHLLRHMANDFATVKTSLRQVLDWATFVAKNKIDWKFVQQIALESNMIKFLDGINGICVKYLGYPQEMFPISCEDVHLRDRILADILNPEFNDEIDKPNKDMATIESLKYGWAKTRRLWANRWKYRIVYDESLFQSFWWLTKNRIKSQPALQFLNLKGQIK